MDKQLERDARDFARYIQERKQAVADFYWDGQLPDFDDFEERYNKWLDNFEDGKYRGPTIWAN